MSSIETLPATTHTPGPWNVEKPYGEPGVYISGPNTGLIAKLYPVDAGYYVGDKLADIEENAKLIAAAPAVRQAAEEALQSLLRLDDKDGAFRVTVITELQKALGLPISLEPTGGTWKF